MASTNSPDIEKIILEKLSNQEIHDLLKKYNLQAGPVTKTTRSIYEKRLRKLFDELLEQKMDWNDVVKEETKKGDLNISKKRKLDGQA
jgi:hypothetical protein